MGKMQGQGGMNKGQGRWKEKKGVVEVEEVPRQGRKEGKAREEEGTKSRKEKRKKERNKIKNKKKHKDKQRR